MSDQHARRTKFFDERRDLRRDFDDAIVVDLFRLGGFAVSRQIDRDDAKPCVDESRNLLAPGE